MTAKPFAKIWEVNAPWAHPIWHSYKVFLVDLTTDTGKPPVMFADWVTHEVIVFALDPDDNTKLLHPPNHVHQFYADSDEAAEARIANIINCIETRQLSPDTDFQLVWDMLFADGVSGRDYYANQEKS